MTSPLPSTHRFSAWAVALSLASTALSSRPRNTRNSAALACGSNERPRWGAASAAALSSAAAGATGTTGAGVGAEALLAAAGEGERKPVGRFEAVISRPKGYFGHCIAKAITTQALCSTHTPRSCGACEERRKPIGVSRSNPGGGSAAHRFPPRSAPACPASLCPASQSCCNGRQWTPVRHGTSGTPRGRSGHPRRRR